MRRIAAIPVMVTVGLVAFVAGRWSRDEPRSAHAEAGERKALYWRCPMHPEHRFERPGAAPCCGMQLEPVYADEPEPGLVRVSADKQQMIGVRTGRAERKAVAESIRTVGRIAFDETQIFRVTSGTDGWIRKIQPVTVGAIVNKDDLLATFYNREFLTSQQTYFYALNTLDRFQKLGTENAEQVEMTNAQIRAAEENLVALGMPELQVRAVAKERKAVREVEIRAPAAGLLMSRNVSPGLRFERGSELYRIADLSRVWILADVFENEARFIRPGARAHITYGGKSYVATMSNVLPQFDASTRTMKVRLEMDNPGYVFRPDMFVDVQYPIALPASLVVPSEAVVHSGRVKTVFLERGSGLFEPREVEVAWRFGGQTGISSGLANGDRIVVSGNFLIDSESRMRKTAMATDPVCGMSVDPAGALKAEHNGRTYYFCSKHCLGKFEANPAAYTR